MTRLNQLAKKIGKAALKSYNSIKEGQVYAIGNDAWPEWIKIGRAVSAEDRLKNYQTSSPFRDYRLIHAVMVEDQMKAEAKAHVKAAEIAERNSEWFKLTPTQAKEILNGL